MSAAPAPAPGLIVLHGNRLESLAQTVFAWLAAHPLAPLEDECFVVQSNGMAEWLKMELAAAHGVCAATRVELPARFLWRAWRAQLGRDAVPVLPALDKLPLTWRLMRLLPRLAGEPAFAPVAAFLGPDDDVLRRLQLAQRLADLFDQYQVYRSDWLHDWAAGHDVLRTGHEGHGPPQPLPADQRWQPALWRAALADLRPDEVDSVRPRLHTRFLTALGSGPVAAGVPRRVVVFGTTQLPQATLQTLALLARHTQVLVAVPNPCRFHWADIVEGRELLRAHRRRQPLRGGVDLSGVAPEALHAHGHPLLAAWGRQARDFVRQLDAFDAAAGAESTPLPRLDLFDDGPGTTLLEQLQAHIRDLVPPSEQPQAAIADDDRSIVFHIAHSAQREVEILHDQLLQLLAAPAPPGRRPLAPRDIVVMVPDIDRFAPAIRAVFGAFGAAPGLPALAAERHIPWGIADQRERGRVPLLVALEWLLRVPQQRFTFGELRDLLDVPAVARRLRLGDDDIATLLAWAAGAGVRWGLHGAQRERLGLAASGEANSWRFGLQRMLLGFATGPLDEGAEAPGGIEPHAEVGGLSAGLAGVLAEWLQQLDAWWHDAAVPRPPQAWGGRLRQLLQTFFEAAGEVDRALLASLDESLADWLAACEAARFDTPIELAAVRETWLDGVDAPAALGGQRRFKAGGVTFCTLLPMRAIPFEVVCLLGMNEADYPRRAPRSDFDLMALPGQSRPGDRSRRDDDRQLMLDALLSARRVLYVGWCGRSQRDPEPLPPSVLVAQLRDHLAAGWGAAVVAARTVEHPLQPFSRRYFEAGSPLFTYAAEWRQAHDDSGLPPVPAAAAAPAAEALTLAQLAAFVRNPVKSFFRHRLQVVFDDAPAALLDDEPFASSGLDRWQLLDEILHPAQAAEVCAADRLARLPQQVARLRRAGRLPMAGPGERVAAELLQTLQPLLRELGARQSAHPLRCDKRALRLAHDGIVLDDWLTGLRGSGEPGAAPVWIDLQASRLADKGGRRPRGDKLVSTWLRALASAACGQPAGGIVIGRDVVVCAEALPVEPSRATLAGLLQAWHDGVSGDRPLPTAVRTGLAWLQNPATAAAVYDRAEYSPVPAEGDDACLARLYPDFASLRADAGFEPATRRLYTPYADWLATAIRLDALPDPAPDEDDDD